jgi:soluble lytic murein transglycosylase-like protein
LSRRRAGVLACACVAALASSALPAHAVTERELGPLVRIDAPIPHGVMTRLADRATRLHRRHPTRAPYRIFKRLALDWRRTHTRPEPHQVVAAIRVVARRYGLDPGGMLRVANCESRLDRHATNGQYLGLFQLGATARSHYLRGDWRDAFANADAAARYVRDAGGFGPWTCGFSY